MVFSSLQAHEKEAFFSLLDEYFQSRPEIFANLSDGSQASPAVSAAMNRASDVTSKMVMGGLRNAIASNNASRPGAGANASANTMPSESEVSSVANRVAAFSLQRNSHLSSPSTSSNAETFPPSSGLKKLGDNIDTSSAKNFFGSLRSVNNSNSAASPSPPAFTSQQQQQSFAPPPVRRVASNATPSPRVVAAPGPPPIPASKRQEEKGDLADVIYDYDSGEAEDLKITEGEVVLITDRTSDDWWTGEVNGKKGLFPASYVKLR